MRMENKKEDRREEKMEVVVGNERYSFERVESFTYLGVVVTEDHDMEAEIKARVTKGNIS